MKEKDRCTYVGKWKSWHSLFPDKPEPDTGWGDGGKTGFPTKKVRCPVCKKRVYADVRSLHDGDIGWRTPPHKKKGWWKRKKKMRKKKRRRVMHERG